MPLVQATVDVRDYFREVTQEIIDDARIATEIGARTGAQVASSIAAQRSKTGRMATMTATPASRSYDGWVASFASRVHYAWFHEHGTLGNRRKKLKQQPRSGRTREPGTGIEPLRFMARGRTAGRRAMLEHIRRGLPR